ncbi:MAG: hypothetical protein ACRDJJ_06715 [Actinomycetota bacterium]
MRVERRVPVSDVAAHKSWAKPDRIVIRRPITSPMSREERERAVHILAQILITHLSHTDELAGKPGDVRGAR